MRRSTKELEVRGKAPAERIRELELELEHLRVQQRGATRLVTTDVASDLQQHMNVLSAARDRCPHCRDARAWEIVRLVWQRLLPPGA